MARTPVAANPYVGKNYIDDNQNMEVPPAYWLQRLYDFDADLVVFPSRYRPFAYVLARRQRHSAGVESKALAATIAQPDTKLCLERGLVPVSLIFRTGVTWSIDNIIAQLAARDIWAHGGGEAAADLADAAEADAAAFEAKKTRDDMYNRSGDAWRSYQARTGASNLLFHDRQKPRQERRTDQTVPSGSTAGSGIVLASR